MSPKKEESKQATRLPAAPAGTVRALLETTSVRARFDQVMKDRAPQFIASLANLVYTTPALKACEPMSVIAAALVAASLDMPIDKNLGFAFIVPYKDRDGKNIAQFQMGYKGYIQLAHRTGQYAALHTTEIYEGEVKGENRITGELIMGERKSDVVIGYAAYLRLVNGFEKTIYMTVDKIKAHAAQYSKNYGKDTSIWKTNFHAMALKTVLRRLLTKWGVMSVELRRAFQAEIPPDETPTAPMNGEGKEGPDFTDPAVVEASMKAEEQHEKDKAAIFPPDEPF